jgi:DNA-binding response OmpR family regulator
VLFGRLSGNLTQDNILSNPKGRIWLTDFAGSEVGPVVWPMASIEAMIRFDWCRCDDLVAISEMENLLVGKDLHRAPASQVDAALRKPVRAIQTVRRHVAQLMSGDQAAYHYLLFLMAMRRLLDRDPAMQLTRGELLRLGHLLIAAAVIGAHSGRNASPGTRGSGIRLDPVNQTVLVDKVPISLRGQSYRLLLILYENAHQRCTRRQLVEGALSEKYDEHDTSQIARLNVAIRRLREKIENDPDQPRYLLSAPGGGYVLLPRGDFEGA